MPLDLLLRSAFIYHVHQFLPALEERRPLCFDLNTLARTRVASLVAAILAHLEGAEAANFYAAAVQEPAFHLADGRLQDGESALDAMRRCRRSRRFYRDRQGKPFLPVARGTDEEGEDLFKLRVGQLSIQYAVQGEDLALRVQPDAGLA